MAQNSISSELNNLLITHDFDVDALSTKTGKPAVNERGVPDASEADMFSFDWVGPTGKNYGTMVILLDQNGGMTVYFGDNLGRTMDPEDKKAWYGDSETDSPGFLEQLKNFAIRTSKVRGGFGLENLSKLKYAIAGQAALTESFYGTRKVSYSGEPTQARLMIKHTRPITEGDKRYRYVESLFIETAEGERFRLPFRKLAGGRAMLEHVRQGGNPYDIRGQHIAETVNQLNVLSQFRRAHQGRVFEGAAGELVTETDQYYQRLNHNLKHMATSRGYNRYFESWKPADISEGDIMVEDLRGMFVETRIDPRIESALPMLAKIQQEAKAMKEAEIFESWAARLVEGTWALPDTPEKMTKLKDWLGEPKPLGPDAEDVTDVLYDLIGDDALFDQLAGMAEEDPSADAVPMVQAWITRNKDQSPELAELAMSFEPAAPEAPPAPAAPEAPPAPAAQPVAEDQLDELSRDTLNAYLRKSKNRADDFHAQGEKASMEPGRKAMAKGDKYFDKRDSVLRARRGARDRLKGVFHPKEAPYGAKNADDSDEMQGVAEAAKGILHRVRYQYDDPSGAGIASGHITLHAPDKTTAARYAASDLSKKGKKNVKVLAVTPQKQGVEEGQHDLVDLEPKIRGLKSEFDKFMKNIERTERDPAYADKANKRYEKMSKRKHPLQQPDHEVDEGDNLQTFEDIIRLSGAPINENVLNDAGSTLDYIIKTYQRDVKDFVQNGDMSEHLYDALYDYYQDDMPYGIKKARSGDPFEWIGDRFYNDLQGHGMMDEGWSIDMSPEEIQKGQDAVNTVAAQSGATAGGVPIGSTPPGINRLTGKPNLPAAPAAPAPAEPANPDALKKHYQQNPLVRGITPTTPAPVNECNYTMENEYCPVHGLEECSGSSMFESELARIKSLSLLK